MAKYFISYHIEAGKEKLVSRQIADIQTPEDDGDLSAIEARIAGEISALNGEILCDVYIINMYLLPSK